MENRDETHACSTFRRGSRGRAFTLPARPDRSRADQPGRHARRLDSAERLGKLCALHRTRGLRAGQLGIYDVTGRSVRVLSDGAMEAGAHESTCDGHDGRGEPLPSGTYYYELRLDRRAIDQGKGVMLR